MIKEINDNELEEIYSLLSSVFNDSEIRSYEDIKALYLHNSIKIYKYDDNGLVGALFLWVFNDIAFIENLGISKDKQRYGYGSKFLNELIDLYIDKKIILEVEADDLMDERIKFYNNLGFIFNDNTYNLPKIGNSICLNPMHLMIYNLKINDSEYLEIKNMIFKYVYSNNETL